MLEPFFAAPVPSVPTWPVASSGMVNLPQSPFFAVSAPLAGVPGTLPPGGSAGLAMPQFGLSGAASTPFQAFSGQPSPNAFAPLPWFGNVTPFVGAEPQPIVSPVALIAAVAARRGQPMGPATDQDIESTLYDALELLPGTDEVEVRCESGRVTLTGAVTSKRFKHDIGELAWAIPSATDVQNNIAIAARRRGRQREGEAQTQSGPSRKQA